MRLKISISALISLSLIGPQKFICEFRVLTSYASHPMRKGPQSASYFINQRSYTPLGPQPNGLHFMAGLWNYSNKSITSSCRNKGILQPLVTSNLASHSPYSFILPWRATLMRPYMTCVGSPSPGCEYIQLTKYCQSYLPSTGCCLGIRSLLHLWCEYEVIRKPTQEHKALHLTGPCLFGMH